MYYKAVCVDCSLQFDIELGGGFVFYQLVCSDCGAVKIAPRRRPAGQLQSMELSQLSMYLSDKSLWTKDGARFDKAETGLIYRLIGDCVCGGAMVPEWHSQAKRRCPKCKSANLQKYISETVSD